MTPFSYVLRGDILVIHFVRAGEADAIADAASRPAPPKPPGDR